MARAWENPAGGVVYISPYNDLDVIAGQATVALEIIEGLDAPAGDIFIAVGGGGLLAGVGTVIRHAWPHCRIVACTPARSPAFAESLRRGSVVRVDVLDTLSDATAGNIEESSVTVGLCQGMVDEIVAIGEAEISDAIRRCLVDDHLLIEGAAGVALAGVQASDLERHGSVGLVILCGGNIGDEVLRSILCAPAR
jgi:threonine dehydratase